MNEIEGIIPQRDAVQLPPSLRKLLQQAKAPNPREDNERETLQSLLRTTLYSPMISGSILLGR